jgi:flagellin-like hook-associated protein FlgL
MSQNATSVFGIRAERFLIRRMIPMSLSVGMNSALLSLIDINTQMSTVSNQLQTGKRFNSAADGAVQWLQISDFTNRASSLSTINDGLTVALSQTNSASTSLASIRSKLVSTQTALNDAYTSQAAVHRTAATTDQTSSDPNTFNLNLTLDPNSTLASFNGQTTLDGNILINNSRVHAGDAFTVGVGTSSVSFKIAPDSATVAATTQSALGTAQAKLTADQTSLTNANTGLTNANNSVAATKSALNTGVVTNGVATPIAIAQTNAAGTVVAGTGIAANVFNITYLNVIANNLQINATSVSAQQYVDGLRSIANGQIQNSAVTATGATALLNNMATVAQGQNTAMSLLSGYVNSLNAQSAAQTAQTTASNAVAADQTNVTNISNNVQTGSANNPYLVATVKDYLNLLSSMKDANGNKAIQISQATPDDYSPITSFGAVGTASGALSVTRLATGNANDAADVRNLFTSTYGASATDTTKAYDVASWGQNGNTYTLSNVHHTGATPGSVTTAADAKRKVAANTFRQMLSDIDQTVKDTTLSGLNLLTGSSLNVALNADGDKFNFQLTGTNSGVTSFKSDGLGLDASAANVSDSAGATNNNFDNNADIDTALGQITQALSTIDTATGLVGDAQSALQDRSTFNKSMIDLLNSTSSSLSSVDTNEASAQLAALQTRQQFATSIMSIIKQSEQNPLQLLR